MRRSSVLLFVVVVPVLVGGCRSASSPASVGSLSGPIATPTPTLTPSISSPSATASPPPSATPSEAAPAKPDESVVGRVVSTLADDGLRVRSEPRVSADSYKFDPLLPRGTRLYVLQGPVSASGYRWYEVAALDRGNLPSGWVADASRDGEPWIGPGTFDCPARPKDIEALASLPRGVGLACFPRSPITVRARLISCNCDIDGSWYTPDWFFLASGGPDLLVAPDVKTVPRDMGDWFALNLDPKGEHPDVLPLGKVVEVTGMFDHPAASACMRTEMDGQPIPSPGCRLEFAVTRLVVS